MIRGRQQGTGYLLLASLLLPLAAHAYIGSFSRFLADDYCSAGMARLEGVLGGAAYWYMHWTGRFSANLLDALAGYIGPGITPYAPAAALMAWLAVLSFPLYQCSPVSEKGQERYLSLLMAAAILFTTLEITPNAAQSLYWGQGMRSVVPPLILASAYAGLVLYYQQRLQSSGSSSVLLMVSGAVTFVAGGFGETYAVLQTSALLVLLMVVMADAGHSRRNLLVFVAAGLLGSALAMVTIVAAPGNKFRQALYPPPPGIEELLRVAMRSMLDFIKTIVASKRHLSSLLGLVALSAMMGHGAFRAGNPAAPSGRKDPGLLALPPIALVLLLSCFVPAAYGMSGAPPKRTLIIPCFVLTCALTAWGYLAGQALYRTGYRLPEKKRLPWRPAIAAIVFITLLNTSWAACRIVRLQPAASRFAADWDRTDALIRSAKTEGLGSITIAPLRNWAGLGPLGVSDPRNDWVNKCAGDYYGLTILPYRTEEQQPLPASY
ncbi:MAG: DUF6056 family protein [Nitrospirota bacterium]